MTFSCWASQCRLKNSRTRARSKLTGLSLDLLEGGGLLEGRLLQPQGEAMAVAAVDLVLEQELQELDVAQLPLARMGDAIGQRREQAAGRSRFSRRTRSGVRSSIIRILLGVDGWVNSRAPG